jgi:serine/threonine-protein kinase
MDDASPVDAARRFTAHLTALGLTVEALQPEDDGTVRSAPARVPTVDLARLPLPQVTIAASHGADGELVLGELLGVGGMGKVLLAEQRALERTVAVKFLKSEEVGARAAADLLREALVTGRLEHPSIVPIYLLARTPEGAPFFAMKRVEGVAWSRVLKEPALLSRVGRAADEPLVAHLEVLLSLCDAVAFAHSKDVLHRDLKPDNVMLGAFGEVYLLDWGIALSLEDDRHLPRAKDEKGIAGTPAYMAPEMASGDGAALSVRTDVYLLGALLHEVLTGEPPHQGATVFHQLAQAWEAAPPVLPASVPAELAAVCRKALAKDPSARFARVEELRSALQDFLHHRGAIRLAEEAAQRLARLETELSKPVPPSADDEVRLAALFSECRFGFEQARRIWPGSTEAKGGLQRATRLWAEHAVARGDARAARALLAELEPKDPALEEAVARLEQAEREKSERLAALEHREREADVDLAGGEKARFTFAFGAAWGVTGFVVDFLVRSGHITFGNREAFITVCVLAVMNAALSERLRRSIRLNLAQRRLLLANYIATGSYFGFWGITWYADVPFSVALTLYLFLVSVQWAIATALFDRRSLVVAIAFAMGTAALVAFPVYGILIFSVTTLVGFGGLASSWLKSGMRPIGTDAGPRPSRPD